MKNKIKYSIIIPHYNTFDKLLRLLKSIPFDESIEVIVVDDKSENKQFEDYQEIIQNKAFLIKNKSSKKGAGVCRNLGLEKANGKWIIFADADDYFTDNMFEILKENSAKNVDIIYFNCESKFEDTGNLAKRHITFRKLVLDYIENNKLEKDLRYNHIVPWAKMIKKSLIDKYKIKFDEVLVSNDVGFMTKIGYFANQISASPKIIYCVTKNKGTLTTIRSIKEYRTRLQIQIERNNFLVEKNEIEYRPYFISFIIWSLEYGKKEFILICKIIITKNLKIFPKNIGAGILSGFYFKKILEKIQDKKYN